MTITLASFEASVRRRGASAVNVHFVESGTLEVKTAGSVNPLHVIETKAFDDLSRSRIMLTENAAQALVIALLKQLGPFPTLWAELGIDEPQP